jgi:hypothetical protein
VLAGLKRQIKLKISGFNPFKAKFFNKFSHKLIKIGFFYEKK